MVICMRLMESFRKVGRDIDREEMGVKAFSCRLLSYFVDTHWRYKNFYLTKVYDRSRENRAVKSLFIRFTRDRLAT